MWTIYFVPFVSALYKKITICTLLCSNVSISSKIIAECFIKINSAVPGQTLKTLKKSKTVTL